MNDVPIVDNFPPPGEPGFLEAIQQVATRPPERAVSTRMAYGRDYQLMICREGDRIHVYSVGPDEATRDAYLALVLALGQAGLQYEQWTAHEYGFRRHVRFEAEA